MNGIGDKQFSSCIDAFYINIDSKDRVSGLICLDKEDIQLIAIKRFNGSKGTLLKQQYRNWIFKPCIMINKCSDKKQIITVVQIHYKQYITVLEIEDELTNLFK